MDEKNKIFSGNLRSLRNITDITQAQVAHYLNIDRSTYAYYETGKTLPNIFMVEKIAAFYGITIDSLLIPYQDIIKLSHLMNKSDSPAKRISGLRI